jgi:hypothetical protein
VSLEQIVAAWWPVLLTIGSMIVWGVRLEAAVKHERSNRRGLERTVNEHYATKQELSTIGGTIAALQATAVDTKASVVRIETKVDAFLVAAVQGQGRGTTKG